MIYKNMSSEDYFKLEGLNQSTLKELKKGSKHLAYYLTHGKPQTPAMKLGSLIDEYILTPKSFDNKYKIID